MSASRPKCRVLFLAANLGYGGAQRDLLTLMRNFDRSRFTMAVAVIDTTREGFIADVPPDVELIDLKVRRLRYALPGVFRVIRSFRPDVILSMFISSHIPVILLRPLLPKSLRLVGRSINTLSESIKNEPFPRAWTWLMGKVVRRLDLIVFQSEHTLVDFKRTLGLRKMRSVIVPNPVDVGNVRSMAASEPQPPFEAGCVELVAVGRFQPVKGYDLLLSAFAMVNDPRLRLTLVGDGPLMGALKAQAEALGVASRVRFPGYASNPYPYLGRANAFMMSSRHEGFPNVVLEALACGTPVISTPLGGVQELLRQVEGCEVAEATTAEAIAAAIERFVSQGPDRRIPESAIREYDITAVARTYEDLLDSVMERQLELV